MSEFYRMRDIDNRDDDGTPFEVTAPTLAEFIPYVDGPLRGDVIGADGAESVDAAIDYLRRERFDLAAQELRGVGVYISVGVSDG